MLCLVTKIRVIPQKIKGGCPICGLSYQVVVDKDALDILKPALFPAKEQQSIVVQKVIPVLKEPKPKDTGNV